MDLRKRIFAFALAFAMTFSLFMTGAIAAPGDFDLINTASNELVADQDTKVVTTFTQDAPGGLITATIQVQNNRTIDSKPLILHGVGTQITFDDRVNPCMPDGSNPYIGGLMSNLATFKTYLTVIPNRWQKISTQYIRNDDTGRFIAAMIVMDDDIYYLTVPAGETRDIAKYYFMPKNGQTLDLDMFSHTATMVTPFHPAITWLANGGAYLTAHRNVSGAITQVYPEAFKIHVKHLPPTGLSANPDNRIREIVGYNTSTMEWSTSATGPFLSTAPVISDDAQTVYVRMKADDNYSPDGSSTQTYGNYRKYLASEPVPVVFLDAFFSAEAGAYASKTSENITTTDGRTHVGDTLRYTIKAGNNGDPRSVWADAVITDVIPDGATFVPNSVTIDGVPATVAQYSYNATTFILSVNLGDIAGGVEKVVTFDAKVDADAHGKTIKNSATVSGEDGDSGEEIEKPIEEPGDGNKVVDKSEKPDVDPITEGDREVTGEGEPGAEIIVTFPGGDTGTTTVEPDGSWTVDVPASVDLVDGNIVEVVQIEPDKEPSDEVEVIVGGRPAVVPASTKTSKNLSRTDGTNRVGDILEYTITVKNDGHAKSLWKNVIITDVLPTQVDYIGNVEIDGAPAGAAASYDPATRTLTVSVGNVPGGTSKVVTFDTEVNDTAYGETFKNTATIEGEGGGEIIVDPDPPIIVPKSATPTIDPITEGDRTVTGGGVAGAEIVVTFPGGSTATTTVQPDNTWTVDVPASVDLVNGNEVSAIQKEAGKEDSDEATATVGGRPSVGEGNAVITKSSENLTRDDGTTRVGDTIEYTVTATNNGPAKSLWANAVMTDKLPDGITLVPASVKIDGVVVTYTYDSDKLLTVQLGSIASGVTKTVTFSATVDADAHNAVIKNHVKVSGKDGGDDGEIIEKEIDEDGERTVVDKSVAPLIDEINEGDRIVTGEGVPGATIKVTLPNRPGTFDTTVQPDGTWTINVPTSLNLEEGDVVTAVQIVSDLDPSDPVDEIVKAKRSVIPFMEKSSENISSTDAYTHVGDTIKYTIIVGNEGSKSVWTDVILTDVMPEHVTFAGNVMVNGAVVPPAFYNYLAATRTLMVSLGSIPYNTQKEVTFDVTIDDTAYGKTIVNSASVEGKNSDGSNIGTETEEPGGQEVRDKSAPPTVDDVTRGDETITGEGEPGAIIEVELPDGTVLPPVVVDPDGTWEVELPDGTELENGQEIIVVQTEEDKDPSDEVIAVVRDKSYRAVTGLVFPMVTRDDLGENFLRMHDIVVELRASYLTPADPALVTTAVRIDDTNEGRFTIENVPFGDYVLSLKRPGYLERCLYVTISEDDPDVIELTPPDDDRFGLWAGDVLGHLTIDGRDILYMMDYFDYNVFEDLYRPECDLTGDGVTNGLDVLMLYDYINRNILMYPGCEDLDLDS